VARRPRRSRGRLGLADARRDVGPRSRVDRPVRVHRVHALGASRPGHDVVVVGGGQGRSSAPYRRPLCRHPAPDLHRNGRHAPWQRPPRRVGALGGGSGARRRVGRSQAPHRGTSPRRGVRWWVRALPPRGAAARPRSAPAEHALTMLPTRFTELIGCELPIQQAGMGGVAGPDLAVAVSAAGGLGTIALHTVPAAMVAATLDAMAQRTSAPLAFNVLMPFLDRDAVEAASSRCRLVEFFYGDPDADLVGVVHEGGALAGWQIGSVAEAEAARDAGCDLVIA